MKEKQPIPNNDLPAPYPEKSVSEMRSVFTLLHLIDTTYIKPDIKFLDKVPNTDGFIEVTDQNQYPIGKLEAQVKTLPAAATSPGHQCTRSLINYCRNSYFPILLIVVDQKNQKAYWCHMNEKLVEEALDNITGDSYHISIAPENCIDGVSRNYIEEWSGIIQDARSRVVNYNAKVLRVQELEQKMAQLQLMSTFELTIPATAVREIHLFLDHYNYILDRIFKIVKDTLYPGYWKIGIGITKYEYDELGFVLFPVQYEKNEPLIRQIKKESGFNIEKELINRTILQASFFHYENPIKHRPLAFANKQLEGVILQVVGKHNLPVENVFLAHEYLVAFIDNFSNLLGFEKHVDSYELKELKILINDVLPVVMDLKLSWREDLKFSEYNIDHLANGKIDYNKYIAEAKTRLAEDYVPGVRVTIQSQNWNIALINFYINYLQSNGQDLALRQYKLGQNDLPSNGLVWSSWNPEILYDNLQIFFNHCTNIYKQLLEQYFPSLQQELGQFEEYDLIIYLFVKEENKMQPHYMMVYYCVTDVPVEKKIRLFNNRENSFPVSEDNSYFIQGWTLTFEGISYQVKSQGGHPIKFMFTNSPTYSYINQMLEEQVKKYLDEKKKSFN